MACFHPINGAIGVDTVTGKRKFIPIQKGQTSPYDTIITVPCGRCIGCRIDHSKMWAIRCTNEMQMHKQACFLTLTYDQEHLPENGTLVKSHLQKFIKRLRKHISPLKIRFFACGEYGEKLSRPHYHLMVFGYQFPDQKNYFLSKGGDQIYTSATLTSLWGKGMATSGKACFQTAAYISRYVTKKLNGEAAKKHYQSTNLETGEVSPILPEYSTQSLKPGIGYDWYKKFHKDVYPSDEIIHEGQRYKVPSYYDKILERENPNLWETVKQNRIENFEKLDIKDFQWRRLLDKEICLQAKLTKHTRDLEQTK